MASEDNEVLTKYLLGDLPEQERERLEERYFVDDGVWEALNAAELELIDLYVRGSLPLRQREQFESYFLDSPRKRQRLEFARTLLSSELRTQLASPPPEFSGRKSRWREFAGFFEGSWRPAFQMTLAAGAIAAAAAVLFFVLHHEKQQEEGNRKSHQGSGGTQQATYQPTPQPSNTEKTNPEETAAHIDHELTTVALVLTPGMVRDASGNSRVHRVMLTDATETVLLHLDLEEDAYPHYEAELRTAEGKQIKRMDGLKSHTTKSKGHIVSMKLPAQSLVKGDYIVRLTARSASGEAQEIDSYTFTVIR